MTWSLWTVRAGGLSTRRIQVLSESEAPPWTDGTPPARLGATGARGVEDRLGWVDLPLTAGSELPEYIRLRDELRAEGVERLVVVAMGGSALSPRAVVSGTRQAAGLEVRFLDSLAPEAVAESIQTHRLLRSVYLISSKSGATVETRALEAVILRAIADRGETPAERLLAVTDPGSPLHRWAERAGYRRKFTAKPNVGGRFSALSAFGLLPAALAGCELEDELTAVRRMREALESDGAEAEPAFRAGALLARLQEAGRFQAHLSASPDREGMLPWLEQLFAESTGKQGTGILPVILPKPRGPSRGDAVFGIHLGRAEGGERERLEAAARAGVPIIHCPPDPDGLLPDVFRWQIAVSVAAFRMGVDPYDQPDVEGTKAVARRLAENPGSAPVPPPVSNAEIESFLSQAAAGGLVINAFGHRSRAAEELVEALQSTLGERLGAEPAVGFGSALLHSLGQIEKGGPDGLSVLMLTWTPRKDLVIPRGPELPRAIGGLGTGRFAWLQAAADYQELQRRGRRALWLDAPVPGLTGLAELVARFITL